MNRKIPLKELCIDDDWGKYGIPASAEEYDNDKTRYLRITDISEDGELLNNDKKSVSAPDIDKYLLKEGDIVFARTGNSTGKSYYHEDKNGKLAFAGFLIKYSLDKAKVNPKYVKFFTITNEYKNWVKNLSVGSTRGNINAQTFGDCPISVPERKQQDLLVRTLSLIIDKIELNNRINGELEAMAKTLYDYWFVQFDFPTPSPTPSPSGRAGVGLPYKTSGGKMVWNEELKRQIPEGWEVKELQEIAKCLMGQSPKGESYNQDGIGTPLLNGPADYENGTLKGRTYTTEPTRLCQKDDLVLCIRATIGNLVYSEQEFCLGRGVAAVRANDKKLSELIYFLLIQEIERFKVQATGSIIVGITKDDLIESKCLIPKNDLINSFHNLIKPQFDKIRVNLKENQKLTELRDWLLPMLINGQVKVN
jgi:type I restriction enzyme S subunit